MRQSDPWLREVSNTFVRVLSRPRFGLSVSETETHVGHCFRIGLPTGDSIILRLFDMGPSVYVEATRDKNAKFFSMKISRFRPPKIGRVALILAKKISDKPVYDVMLS